VQIKRKSFFDGYRAEWGQLTQSQVDGLGLILSFVEDYNDLPNMHWVAYALATIKHECADTWAPIEERGPKAYFDRYDAGTAIGQRLGNVKPGDGFLFRGRGYVQLTGRANYRRMGGLLSYGLEARPDLAQEPTVAYEILSVGMRDGLFTGKKLSDYVNEQTTDYVHARRIINGLDQAAWIARYATAFERIVKGATE
jgi:hypothetical protein